MIVGVNFISPFGKSHPSGVLFVFQCYAVKHGSDVVKPVYSKGNYDQIRNNLTCVNYNKEPKGKH